MMVNTNTEWSQLSDMAIVAHISDFVRKSRLQQNIPQAQLAEMAGLNRWTISQIEKGEAINLTSLIAILRALDALYVLQQFDVQDEISPLAYAKLKKKEKVRARGRGVKSNNEDDLGW